MSHRVLILTGLWTSLMPAFQASALEDEDVRIYVGTYTSEEGQGINLLEMDSETGALESLGVVAETKNPSFLAIHPNGRFLYAVNEIGQYEGDPSGSVHAFSISPDSGQLSPLNRQSSKGAGPCHIITDPAGKVVLVANYSGGNVTALPILENGSLGEPSDVEQHEGSGADPRRQQGPHAHSINLDPGSRYAVAADLGIDALLVYRIDTEAGSLTPNAPPAVKLHPGAGPRHLDFHPNGRLAFAINELDSTITVFRFDPEAGSLEATQTITTLPDDFDGRNYPADIHVHPSGRFLYGSNRGHDSIAIYAIDERAGTISSIGHHSTGGRTPRNFSIAPSGRFLLAANQDSDSILVFRIDEETGLLEPTGHEAKVPSPVCIQFHTPGD